LKLREKLRAALSAAALLDYSPEELLADLQGAQLGTVERLASALVALARNSQCQRVEPVLVNLDAIWNSSSPPDRKLIVHRPPKMAFVASGVEYDPSDIRRFDGHELCFVPSWRRGMPYLEVFEDKAFIKNWLRLDYASRLARAFGKTVIKRQSPIPGAKMDEPGQELPPPTQGSVGDDPHKADLKMWEHAGHHGDRLVLAPGWGYPDLTRVGRGFLDFGDWNDIISSVYCPGQTEAGFWEHINYEGSMVVYWSTSAYAQGNLTYMGWNDRISSVQHWG
jgi:hypothetical protein